MSDTELSAATSDGMRQAKEQREHWKQSLAAGKVSFSQVVEFSKTHEYRYLSKLRLVDIIAERPGWTTTSAAEILDHNGFTIKDTVQSIRRSPTKVNRMDIIMASDRDNWRARPDMPSGWPWQGKLTTLTRFMDERYVAAMPAEMFMSDHDRVSDDVEDEERDLVEESTRDDDVMAIFDQMLDGDSDV